MLVVSSVSQALIESMGLARPVWRNARHVSIVLLVIHVSLGTT